MDLFEKEHMDISYQLRISRRVKHAQWRFTPHRGLELVVPPHFKPEKAPELLATHRAWIEKILKKNAGLHTPSLHLPDKIHFLAFNQTWEIHYCPTLSKKPKLIDYPQKIILTCYQDALIAGKKLLRTWIKKKAYVYLAPQLLKLSRETNLYYDRFIVRQANSVWGSCNHRKTISLNTHLVFLPESLMRHVILHELCHLQHLNHSPDFWKTLTQFDEHCHQHKKALQQAQQFLPSWL